MNAPLRDLAPGFHSLPRDEGGSLVLVEERKNQRLLLLFLSFSSEEKFQKPLVNLKNLSTEFVYEIRYATPNNFIGETLYDCPKCLLQPDVAEALLKANQF